jgi:hypothetical protein
MAKNNNGNGKTINKRSYLRFSATRKRLFYPARQTSRTLLIKFIISPKPASATSICSPFPRHFKDCLANMALHDIDLPRIWHGNTLTGAVTYGDLFSGAPSQFDYLMTNPPFGSKEGKDAQAQFPYKCGRPKIKVNCPW